jgi:arabinose-5-phosphate isomerase
MGVSTEQHAYLLEGSPFAGETSDVMEESQVRGQPVLEARRVLSEQSRALDRLAARLESCQLGEAIELLLNCPRRVVVTGMGKSGLIGRKIAATFSSTGTPAVFLHPGDALHGDLGMVMPGDVVLALSNSGSTDEVLRLLPYLKSLQVPVVSLVGRIPSPLAEHSAVALDVSVEKEACALNLAPTTSTLVTLAMGDALAVCLTRARRFNAADFAKVHPAGALGQMLTAKVGEQMRVDDLPIVEPTTSLAECLFTMTARRCDVAIIVDEKGHLCGLVSDGDLRRYLAQKQNQMRGRVKELMRRAPVTIWEGATVGQAEETMSTHRVKSLIVVDGEGGVVGLFEADSGRK